ncbi:TonB-dependent receptor plug domain-containing protein, partial [Agrobacterium sp.]|uniref:TonB-dependent receptor plug domain-containing protein n=1 Tax=Agrobacterium sp. TaxID=361 RepID=UPI0028AFF94F
MAKASVCLLVTMGGIVSISPVMAQETTIAPANATVLDNIIVKLPNWLRFGGKGKSDTGTTTLEGALITNKTSGLGDANSILRNLPNVQYQNDSDNDAGVDGQDMINLRPQELSISGAKVYENNFILNGIGINNVTGSQESFVSDLPSYETKPNIYAIFGLHSQTMFVPSDFLDEVNVLDSNVSARYGQFQGGVVEYSLAKPKTDKVTGSVSYGFESDKTTSYVLGTKDGLNLQNNPPPDFYRYKTSASVNVPITDYWAVIGQYSRSSADTSKAKDYRLYGNTADDVSENNFYRLASRHDTDLGVFTLDGSYTDYDQEWDAFFYRDAQIYAQTKSFTTQLRWENDLDTIVYEPLGIDNVKIDAKGYFNKSRTINDGGDNEFYVRTVWARSSINNNDSTTWFNSTDADLLSWCQTPLAAELTGTSEVCHEGGFGNKSQGQEEKGFKADIDGDFLAGTFSTGFDYRRIDAYRKAEEYTQYSSNYTLLNLAAPNTAFTCPAGDTACTYEQYTRIKTVTPAYHKKASINAFDGYAEVDQTWDWLNLRAGVHVSYEDYFGNLNF